MDKTSSPQSPRRYMDFAPRSATRRPARPVAPERPAQPARPVAPPPRPAPQPARPAMPHLHPARAPHPSRPQAKIVHEHVESTTILYPPTQPPKRRPAKEDDYLDIETSGLGIIEDLPHTKVDTPDNSSFVLGGQSPFINTDKVDKRPLSSHLPKEKPSTKGKNTYDKPSKFSRKATKPAKTTPTVVTGSASRGNSISLVIAIILTIIFGAIVGTFIYLAFFQ